jgi:hypothetical protein
MTDSKAAGQMEWIGKKSFSPPLLGGLVQVAAGFNYTINPARSFARHVKLGAGMGTK